MVAETGDDGDVAELELFRPGAGVAALLDPVPCAVVVEEVIDNGLVLLAVHRELEGLGVVVVVVVRDEGEVEKRRELLGTAVVQVDREQGFRRFDNQPHVVDEPDCGMVDVVYNRFLHLAKDLVKGVIQPPQGGQAPESGLQFCRVRIESRPPVVCVVLRGDQVNLPLADL